MVLAFIFYAAWNVLWISSGRVPPSIFTALTGLPCPTTGGTRSFLALLEGNIGLSLWFNPMTIPFISLLLLTGVHVARRGVVSTWVGPAWMILLGLAWVIKLLSPTGTW